MDMQMRSDGSACIKFIILGLRLGVKKASSYPSNPGTKEKDYNSYPVNETRKSDYTIILIEDKKKKGSCLA